MCQYCDKSYASKLNLVVGTIANGTTKHSHNCHFDVIKYTGAIEYALLCPREKS